MSTPIPIIQIKSTIAALKRDPNVYHQLSPQQKSNPEIVAAILDMRTAFLQYIPTHMRDDEEIVLKAISTNNKRLQIQFDDYAKRRTAGFQYASQRLQNSIPFLARATIVNPEIINILEPEKVKKIEEYIKTSKVKVEAMGEMPSWPI